MTRPGAPASQPAPASAPEPVAPAGSGPAAAPEPASLGRQIGALVFDIAAPIALYYGLRAAGLSSLQALAIGAVIPAASAAWVLIRHRRANMVALLVLGTIAASLIISVISHSPRFLLAKDGLITSVWGIWFLASLGARRPAAFLFARPLLEGRRAFAVRDWDALWDAEPRFRRIWRVSTVIWGLALLADAVIRVVMAYTLPVDVVPGLGGALYPVTFVVIQIITNIYYQFAGLNRLLGARWLAGRGSARQHVRVERAGRVERGADPGEQASLGG